MKNAVGGAVSEAAPARRLQAGPRAVALRLAGAVTLLLAVIVVVAAVPSRYAQLLTVSPAADTLVGQLRPEDARLLVLSGLTLNTYALYFTVAELLTAVISFGVACLIIWGRSDDWMALFVALFLVAAPTTLPLLPALEAAQPQWQAVSLAWRLVFLGALLPLFFLFPDGRFVPRWTRWLAPAYVVFVLLGAIFPGLQPPTGFGRGLTVQDAPTVLLAVGGMTTGVLAQVWRYFHISGAPERQRTRWVVFGFGVLLVAFFLGVSALTYLSLAPVGLSYAVARLAGPTLILVGLDAVSIAIGVSVLRYRLWDIDVIIRRTLVYTLLSGLLVLAYFSSVIVFQALWRSFTGQNQSPIVNVASTLAIAALSVPLRNQVQAFIDRRFFRRKYDAARILAGFSKAARDEVDLDRLRAQLVEAVDDAMQPEHVSLWLRPNAPVAASRPPAYDTSHPTRR